MAGLLASGATSTVVRHVPEQRRPVEPAHDSGGCLLAEVSAEWGGVS